MDALPVVVRRAAVADAPAIAAIHRLSRAAYYGAEPDAHDRREEMWSALLQQSQRLTYVAESSGIRGFISMACTAVSLELTALYVHPDHFGTGVGSLLYGRFTARKRPHRAAVLEVWAGNGRAISFYEQRGWTATPTTRPGPDGQPFVTYRLV